MPDPRSTLGRVERELHAGAVAEQRDALALHEVSPVPIPITEGSRGKLDADAGAARIAQRDRARVVRSAVCSMWTSIASSRGAISTMFGRGRR